MNTTIKSAIAACGFLAAVSTPLTAGADTSVFSGKNTNGGMLGSNGNLFLEVGAFKNATMSKSNKTNSSGAYIYGYNFTETECWHGFGFTDTIQFKATGSLPKTVTASGSVLVTWENYCGSSSFFTESVTFNMDLSALTDQVSSNWGTTHNEYANIKVNTHYNYKNAPAAAGNASSITSPEFGLVSPSSAYVGQSKGHDVEIIR